MIQALGWGIVLPAVSVKGLYELGRYASKREAQLKIEEIDVLVDKLKDTNPKLVEKLLESKNELKDKIIF